MVLFFSLKKQVKKYILAISFMQWWFFFVKIHWWGGYKKKHVGIWPRPSVSICLASANNFHFGASLNIFIYIIFITKGFFSVDIDAFLCFIIITQLHSQLRDLYLSTDRCLPVHWGPGPDPAGRWSWGLCEWSEEMPSQLSVRYGVDSVSSAGRDGLNDRCSINYTDKHVERDVCVWWWGGGGHLCRSVLRLCLNCGLMWDSRSVTQWHTGVDWAGRGSNTSRVDLKHKISLVWELSIHFLTPCKHVLRKKKKIYHSVNLICHKQSVTPKLGESQNNPISEVKKIKNNNSTNNMQPKILSNVYRFYFLHFITLKLDFSLCEI